MLRLFFALWPDPATRDALAATAGSLRRICGGRAPPANNLHLTLAFLGDVPEVRVPELADLAATLVAEPLVLELDRIGYWRQQRLVWAGPQSCPDALAAPAQAGCGPLAWRPTQFVLACAQPAGRGVRYRIAGNWPLKSAAAGL